MATDVRKTGNSENMTDSEAVQKTREKLTKTVSEFQEADMRKKDRGLSKSLDNVLSTSRRIFRRRQGLVPDFKW